VIERGEPSVHLEVHFEDGMFCADAREWSGCFALGETLDELVEAVHEAIGLYVTAEEQELVPIRLRIDGLDVRLGSDRELSPAREPGGRGPLRAAPGRGLRTREPLPGRLPRR
jgi:predicted RNase H-like HicB family nuclease